MSQCTSVSLPMENLDLTSLSTHAWLRLKGRSRLETHPIDEPILLKTYSLCPMNRSVPIEANGIIPVNQQDVSGIPQIAFTIPDFEGQAVLRLFSNSSQTEIGCYSAVITNGATLSHPSAVGTVLGLFTLVAIIASAATVVYGDHIPTIRTHYAHSLSISVVFAVFHHIFYTGALSMNWPSVTVAWWSNFAWTAGMIHSQPMQDSINQLLGSNHGNLSLVGAAGSGGASDNVAGGYSISQIYKRDGSEIYRRWSNSVEDVAKYLRQRSVESHIAKRAASSNSVSSPWYGRPVPPGLPIPGNFSGLAGTLSQELIPASNAFMTGFLWFIILTVLVPTSILAFKCVLEILGRNRWLRTKRLGHFQNNWTRYTLQAVLRTMFVAFFMIMFLTMFEFTFSSGGGVDAVAALVFMVVLFCMSYYAAITCYDRLHCGHYEVRPDRLHLAPCQVISNKLPWFSLGLESQRSEKSGQSASICSIPVQTIHYVCDDPQKLDVHHDEDFIERRGWLFARFRRTRWWFFPAWLLYEFIRACFYGGAAGHPMTQVFGLLVVEILALVAIILVRPFEGTRLNALMVYCLGFSKVATVALSAAFDPRFNLARITTTAIGMVIIVIQGILTILLLIAIVVGAITSYMSLTRNTEDFKPRSWAGLRERYFVHLQKAPLDRAPTPAPSPEEPKEPYFHVTTVRRETKIADEVDDSDPTSPYYIPASRTSISKPETVRASRVNSVAHPDSQQSNLPFGARNVRGASWSTRDFEAHNKIDSPSSSRHVSALYDRSYPSHPNSRRGSMYGTPAPQIGSETSLVRENDALQAYQQPIARTPATRGAVGGLDMRRSRAKSLEISAAADLHGSELKKGPSTVDEGSSHAGDELVEETRLRHSRPPPTSGSGAILGHS